MIKKTLNILLALSIGAVIIWLSVRKLTPTDRIEIQNAFSQANYWWIAISLLVAFISNVSRSIRWKILLKPMGYRPSFLNVMLSILVAYFANLGLPRLGEIVRCGLLRTHENIPFEKSLGTVVTERVIDLLVFFLLFTINLVVQFNQIHSYIEEEILSQFDIDFNTGLLLLAITVVICLTFFFLFKERLKSTSIYQKTEKLLLGFWSGIKSVTNIDKPLLFIFHSIFIWFCYWLMSYIVLQSLPITETLSPLVSLSALTIGTIGMIVVQGGLGIYPLLVAGVLVTYGITYPTGYAMGWLIWGSQTLGIIIAGLVAIVMISFINKKENNNPQ